MHELGDRVDEPRAAHPHGLDVPDHLELERVAVDLDSLDRPVSGAHPALDLGRLERRSGGSRRRQHSLDRAERDLAVGPDVDEQPQSPVARQARGEHPGDDVAADVGSKRGEHVRRGPRMYGDAEFARPHGREGMGGDGERRHRERLGVDAERDLHHRHVAADRYLVDLRWIDRRLGQHLGGQLGERLVRPRAQCIESRVVHHRR